MSGRSRAEEPALGTSRQATIEQLCEHFANDAMDVAEFERRVDVAHKAASVEELEALLADMPAETAVVPKGRGESTPVQSARTAVPQPDTGHPVRIAPPDLVRERQLAVGIFGAASRTGAWIPARQIYAAAVMGGTELDFREARLGPGITEVTAFALCGGIDIVVPPGLRVECNGVGIMGAFVHDQELPMSEDPAVPVLRINGAALLGAVEVSVRLPGETPRDAKRRRKLAKREQRRRITGR